MNADKQNEILGLSWCSEEAHRQVGGRWKDRRMSSGWSGWKFDAKVVGWWLVSGRGKVGVSVAEAAETLESLPGGGMKLVPSQAR